MPDPTYSDRLSWAVCDLIDCTPECASGPELCRQVSAAHCAQLAQILRERHGGSSSVADWLDGLGAHG